VCQDIQSDHDKQKDKTKDQKWKYVSEFLDFLAAQIEAAYPN